MRKIMSSLLVLLVVVGAVTLGTRAFFSDTETSTGNRFQAGDIDLKIDNDSYYNGAAQIGPSPAPNLTWDLSDLTNQVFFYFRDVKPGDLGEDTISMHVDTNDAWLCTNVTLTGADEDTNIDPEVEAGDTSSGPWAGELDEELQFFIWADDGDNVFEEDETPLIAPTSLGSLPQNPGTPGLTLPIVDAQLHALKGTPNFFSAVDGDAFTGGSTGYLGVAWCFGAMDVSSPETQGAGNPLLAPGVECVGTLVGNQSQTDNVIGNISFYAVQSRNNPDYDCETDWNPNLVP